MGLGKSVLPVETNGTAHLCSETQNPFQYVPYGRETAPVDDYKKTIKQLVIINKKECSGHQECDLQS